MTSALRNFPVTSRSQATNSSRALDKLCLNTLRFLSVLSVDAVEQAKPALALPGDSQKRQRQAGVESIN